MNIETLMQVVFTTMTGKLCERFGSTLIFTIGSLVNFIGNIFFAFPKIAQNYVSILIFRAIAACGLGLSVPSAMPINFTFVQVGKLQNVITIISMMIPIAALCASLSAGLVADSIGW